MYTVQGKERISVTIFKTFTVQCTVYWCSTVERCRRVPLLTFRAPLTVRAADRAENLAQLQESSIIVLVGKQIYNRKQLPLLRHQKALYSDQVILRTAKHPFLDRESDIATTFHSFCLYSSIVSKLCSQKRQSEATSWGRRGHVFYRRENVCSTSESMYLKR